MKTCAYCGQANEDAAAVCAVCHKSEFKVDAAPQSTPPPLPTAAPGADEFWLHRALADPVWLFRALVIVASGGYLVTFLLRSVEWRLGSAGTRNLLAWEGYGALVTLPRGIVWLTMLLYVAMAVGLCQFSAAARRLFAIFTAGFAVLTLFGGMSVMTAVESFLALVIAMADGGILALAYCPPLKEKFA